MTEGISPWEGGHAMGVLGWDGKDAAAIPNANENLKKQTLVQLFKQIEFVPRQTRDLTK